MAFAVSCLPAKEIKLRDSKRDPTLPAMAYSRLAWLLAATAIAVVVFLPAPVSAELHLVGGPTGWNLSYPIGWPEGRIFRVGDSLVFDYNKGEETVTEVDSETFRDCYRQGNTINEWASGHDVIKLNNPGRRWFFSSHDNHCDLGLKLVVNVVGVVAAPAPAPVVAPTQAPRLPPTPSPTTGPPATPPASPGPAPEAPDAPPSPSAAALNHYRTGEAFARAAVVAGAIATAVFM